MNKLLIILCVTLSFLIQEAWGQSSSASIAFTKGIAAYDNGKYIEALPYLRQAASSGIAASYHPLIDLYADGDYDGNGIGNYQEALFWTLQAMNKYFNEGADNRDLAAICLMYYDPLCFLTGDYQETIDHTASLYENGMLRNPYLMNQIAASYLKLGNIDKTIEWLNKATALAKAKDLNHCIQTTNAILSKIYLDTNNYTKALEYSQEAASEVAVAAYVYGRSLIETDNNPSIGKQWVKSASEYDYSGIFEINCFEEEIENYWRSIMNATYR